MLVFEGEYTKLPPKNLSQGTKYSRHSHLRLVQKVGRFGLLSNQMFIPRYPKYLYGDLFPTSTLNRGLVRESYPKWLYLIQVLELY